MTAMWNPFSLTRLTQVEEVFMTSLETRIRQRAHALWEREGRPDGQSERHWEQAKTMIAAERQQRPVLPSTVVTGPWRRTTPATRW